MRLLAHTFCFDYDGLPRRDPRDGIRGPGPAAERAGLDEHTRQTIVNNNAADVLLYQAALLIFNERYDLMLRDIANGTCCHGRSSNCHVQGEVVGYPEQKINIHVK